MLNGQLNILVDAAHAFDHYAILLVKHTKKLISSDQSQQFLMGLAAQIGVELLDQIVDSAEFERLINLNHETFEAVDLAKEDKIAASGVHKLNAQRFLAKKALQAKFFQTHLTEVKNDDKD